MRRVTPGDPSPAPGSIVDDERDGPSGHPDDGRDRTDDTTIAAGHDRGEQADDGRRAEPSPQEESSPQDERDAKIEFAKEVAERRHGRRTDVEARSTDGGTDGEATHRSAPDRPPDDDRRWWHRHLDPEDRQRIMTDLAIRRKEHWLFRFATMQMLAVVVAVMGLSADSAAVVIGAMLLAPLMTPVLAVAAALSMALFKKSLRSLAVLAAATGGSIVLAYVLAAVVVRGELPDEVTSRVAPDLRDLVVALGAGTAGAYATVRKDASSSLPGVAVAVALVPPLGAVGMSLQAGNATFARGAMLLYTTNLAAIVLAASIVFLTTGFVPPRRLASTFPRTALAATAVAAAVFAIAVPLVRASTSAVEASDREIEAREIVDDWLGAVDTRTEPSIDFDGENGRITVGVRSFEQPIDAQTLTDDMRSRFGPDQAVSVEWDVVQRAEATTTLAPTTTVLSDAERLNLQVASIVDAWLAQELPDSGRRDGLRITDDVVFLDASGVGEAPSVASLAELLDAELERTLTVRLTWLERESVDVDRPPTPDEQVAASVDVLARTWAESREATVIASSFDGRLAVVEVAAAETPDASDLVADLTAVLDPAAEVRILYTRRLDITTTTPTSTPTTTEES